MVLDRLPRSALTLIIPSGCQLAVASGWLDMPCPLPLGNVGICRHLAGDTLARVFVGRPKTQEQSAKINWLLNLILALAVSGAGMMLLLQGEIPDWLALKVLAVGAIFCAGVLLDLLFKPAVDLFIGLAATPDDPE